MPQPAPAGGCGGAAKEALPMPLILLLLAAAVVAKFFWLRLAVAGVAAAGRLIGAALARHDDRDG
jgi:hypothetical protein